MRRYQMPCSRKAASRNKPSTSLIMRSDPTQVFWTAETVPGMEAFRHLSACWSVCLTETGSDVVSFLVVSGDCGSDAGHLDLSAAHSCTGRHKSSFICFLSPLWAALWLHFRLANTHIHGPPHIYFVPNSFSVNLACQSRLNMAIITGRYESQVSIALLPNVNDWRHRNFHYSYKKNP